MARWAWWLVAWSAPKHYLNQCWLMVNWTIKNEIQLYISQNLNKCNWKRRLENCGHFVSASSVKPIVSELFSRGPIGSSSALVQIVAWHWTDAKQFPKPIMTWHPFIQMYQRAHCIKNIFPVKPVTNLHFHILTQIKSFSACPKYASVQSSSEAQHFKCTLMGR